MAWIQRDGKQVNAHQFGMGTGNVPGQRQEWDRDGCYYVTTIPGNRKVRLGKGDWVCTDDKGAVIDVQTNGKFVSQHINDPTVNEPESDVAAAPPSVIAVTTEELEMEREKLILDAPSAPVVRPHESPVLMGRPEKRGPGRPKGAKNKPKVVEPLEEL